MRLEEIKNIVTDDYSKKFRVTLNDGSTKIVRLWNSNGTIAILNKGSKRHGHVLSDWYDHYSEWQSLRAVEGKEVDYYKRFVKRASDGLKMLTESGLWSDIKETIEHFFALSEEEQRQLVNDIVTDGYELFYKQTWGDGKYNWVHCYQVFESFARKNCWKSIAWRKWEREKMAKQVEEAIKNGGCFDRRWENGYDNSIEVRTDDDGSKLGWYSEEYRGCGNGHYYLLFDATHAIFYEND